MQIHYETDVSIKKIREILESENFIEHPISYPAALYTWRI